MILNPQEADRNPQSASRVAAVHGTARIIVLAIAMSVVTFTVLGLVFVADSESEIAQPQWLNSFYVIALFLALGSIAVRRAQFRWLRLEAVAGLRGVEGLISHFFKVTVISAALAEAVGMLGLLAGLMGGGRRDVLTFGAISLLVLLFSYPRRAAWQQAANYFAQNAPGVAKTK